MKLVTTVLACLTLFGCEAMLNPHFLSGYNGDASDAEVNTTDAGANATNDSGANSGSMDFGGDTASNIDTSTTKENPCKNLEDTAAGNWYLIKGYGAKDGDGIMSMDFAQDEQGCAFTTNGDGAFIKGATYHVAKGANWPQKITKDGWEVNFVLEEGILTYSVIELCCTSLMVNQYSR